VKRWASFHRHQHRVRAALILSPPLHERKVFVMDIYHHFPPDPEVLNRLDAIAQKLDLVLRTERRMENEMALDFTKMIAAAAAQSTVTNGVLQALQDLGAKITDLSAQLAAALAANDPVAAQKVQDQLDSLATGIKTNDDKIAAAIATPGPVPTPTPTPTPIPTT